MKGENHAGANYSNTSNSVVARLRRAGVLSARRQRNSSIACDRFDPGNRSPFTINKTLKED